MYLGCRGLRWKIPFINQETNQWETPGGISTIALIALWYVVPIALWLSPNSYNVCARNQELDLYTVGWWRLSCSLLQKSSHCCTGCVVCRLYADPPWCSDDLGNIRWQSAVGRRLTKLLRPDWVGSQIGCWKFVPGSWSRCWCAGINSGVVPHFTNSTNCGNHSCVCLLSPRLLLNPVQVWPALFQLY